MMGSGGGGVGVEVGEYALAHLRGGAVQGADGGDRPVGVVVGLVEAGHVDAGDVRQRADPRRPVVAASGAHGVNDLSDHVLAVAEHDGVQERRQRLGVEGARAARDHDRVVRSAVGGPQGNPAQVQDREEVGVGELVLQAEPHHVEVAHGEVILEGDQRQPARAQERLQIGPGRVDPLRRHVRTSVQDVVQDLQADVRLRDLVDLGERQREAHGTLVQVLAHRPPLVAQVTAGLLDQGQ
jgi:hypothetical protein